MDSITQAVLGAAVGMASAPRLGKRAAMWGAVGGVIPDLDVFAAAPFGPWARLEVHRGSSHALWFGPVVGSLFGYTLWRHWYRKRDPDGLGSREGRRGLVLALVLGIFTHPLLDLFTSYGTQLLAPFSRERFVIDGVGIIDLFYTVPLAAAVFWALKLVARQPHRGARVARASLALTTAYVFTGAVLNHRTAARAERELAASGVHADVVAYSTLLQILLRRVVARSGEEIRVGYATPLRSAPIDWWVFQQSRHPLVERLRYTPEGQMFEWFAAGQTHGNVEREGREWVVTIDDIRYGLPGHPETGLWGIRARYDEQGKMLGSPERFSRERDSMRGLARVFAAALGRDPEVFHVGSPGAAR
ncbi:MAG TPA: metal-dependent hydrolase [Polyangiaceae bacterium]